MTKSTPDSTSPHSLDPGNVLERTRTHFSDHPAEAIVSQAEALLPEPGTVPALSGERIPEQLALWAPRPERIDLSGYLACALTNLTEEQRALLFHLSDLVST